jgi:hypothetical protein
MTQDHNDDGRGLIVDDDPALDFILYKEMTKDDQKQQGGRGGCLGIIVLLLLPVTSMVLFCLKG